MPYATVMLVGTERESFADAQGHFRFTRLPFDTYHLRARQIGYAPVDTTIVLAGNAASSRCHPAHATGRSPIARGRRSGLTTLAAAWLRACPIQRSTRHSPASSRRSGRMQTGSGCCSRPTPSAIDASRRWSCGVTPGGTARCRWTPTKYESRARHPYRVGRVVYVDKDSHGHPVRLMYLPTFRDLADSTFLGTHCFHYGGTEVLGPMRTDAGAPHRLSSRGQHPSTRRGGIDLPGFGESHHSKGRLSIGERSSAAPISAWPHRDDDVPSDRHAWFP